MTNDKQKILAMLELKRASRGPVLDVLGLWLTAQARKLWPWHAGLRFWEKTNCARTWVLVSRHHPAILTWSWSVWVALFPRTSARLLFRPWLWLLWNAKYSNRQLVIPWLIRITFHEQFRSDWMLSHEGEARLRAFAFSDEPQEATAA